MQGIASCPDRATLQRFLLGASAAAEAEALEAHLQWCDACGAALNTLHARDTVVDAIRAQRGRAVQSPSDVVRHLTERIKGLRAPVGAQDQTEAPAPATAPPNEPDAQASPIGDTDTATLYDFLAPAVAAGELGCLGHYRVRKVLGTGGMGVVFLAYDPQLDRLVALKAMLPTTAASASAKRRFLREARAAAAIKHDHIVTIYQVGEDRGAPFLAMELLEGESLHDRLVRDHRLSPGDTLRVGREIALALAAAHRRGLIHRDIKPGNIWLESVVRGLRTTDDRVKLLDFGLARATADDAQLTQTGAILGTPAFMAPEQLHGQALDARCDLFSLGCVLYCMTTGEQPFKGADSIATLMAITTQAPRPPQTIDPTLPPALCDLILRLLAKDPADRLPSAQAVIEAIGAIERGAQPSGLAALPQRCRPALASRRRCWSRVAAAVVAATLTAMVGLAGYLCGPTMVRWVANEGEVIIEIDDAQVQAVIDQTRLIIRDQARKREYQIKPGRQPLTAGDYLLEVTEVGSDLRLFTKEFTIARAGNATVRVTFDPRRHADRAARAVSWSAAVPRNTFADRAHVTADVLDWRDIAGADLTELRAWAAALGPDFHVAWVSTRRGRGPGLFNAVALREKNPLPYRLFTGLTAGEAAETYKQQGDEGYRPVQTCVSPQPDRPGAWLDTVLCVKDGTTPYNWGSNWASCRAQIDRWAKKHNRPAYLFGPPGPDVAPYRVIMPGDEGRRWQGQYGIAADELVPTVEHYQRKGWRPDVLAPHWKDNHLRFMLVAVDNADQVDWRFRMAMPLEQYRKESVEQKRGGLFPLTVVSYGDDAEVRYAAIWVRHRLPEAGK